MRKIAVGSALSPTGAALVAGNRFNLAFEEIKNLSLIVTSIPKFKSDKKAQAYRHLLLKAEIHRKKNPEDMNIVNGYIGPYIKMLNAFVKRITESDLTWLQENDVEVSKSGTEAVLPLSTVYEWCMTHDEAKLNDLECTLFMLFRFLQDPNTVEGKKLLEICKDFKVNAKESASNNAVSNIVKKVKQNVPAGSSGEAPQTADVIKIVQAIVGGGEDGDMGSLAQGILSGTVTIPQLVEQVKNAVAGDQQEPEEEDDEDEDEEETQTQTQDVAPPKKIISSDNVD